MRESALRNAYLGYFEWTGKNLGRIVIRGSKDWAKYYTDLQMQNIQVEKKRKQIDACKLRFEAERTERADKRRIV